MVDRDANRRDQPRGDSFCGLRTVWIGIICYFLSIWHQYPGGVVDALDHGPTVIISTSEQVLTSVLTNFRRVSISLGSSQRQTMPRSFYRVN
jgi:hypothetical protein